YTSRPSRGAFMRRREGGAGPAPAGVVRSCTPGRTPEQPRQLLRACPGPGTVERESGKKPGARWTGAFSSSASAPARHTPSLGGKGKETGKPQARSNLGSTKLGCMTIEYASEAAVAFVARMERSEILGRSVRGQNPGCRCALVEPRAAAVTTATRSA